MPSHVADAGQKQGGMVRPSNPTSTKKMAVWKGDKHASCGLLLAVDGTSKPCVICGFLDQGGAVELKPTYEMLTAMARARAH